MLAAGPLAAALGTAGASIPEADANFYAEGVRRGGTLVIAKTSDDMADRAYDIMQQYGAVDLDKRGAKWRASGWTRFDENAEPYTGMTSVDEEWRESSKVGTVGGGVAGAATGAAIGSAAGPVGTVAGGVAGAAAGAGLGLVYMLLPHLRVLWNKTTLMARCEHW